MKKYSFAVLVVIAIASCLPKTTPVRNMAPSPAELFGANCSGCHGYTGVEGKAPRLDHTMQKDHIVSIINNGQGSMPRFSEKLTEKEIDAIANFVVSLQPAK